MWRKKNIVNAQGCKREELFDRPPRLHGFTDEKERFHDSDRIEIVTFVNFGLQPYRKSNLEMQPTSQLYVYQKRSIVPLQPR